MRDAPYAIDTQSFKQGCDSRWESGQRYDYSTIIVGDAYCEIKVNNGYGMGGPIFIKHMEHVLDNYQSVIVFPESAQVKLIDESVKADSL